MVGAFFFMNEVGVLKVCKALKISGIRRSSVCSV